ncbi:DUF3168 domain-containing protein [Microbulbifer sp. ZKSA006]|uniref:DUF3168 domain-containing protein n=1 Tax=Microbulbifer sp. ZKSA006 TaxID=3243390 RepID=UPI0040391BD4
MLDLPVFRLAAASSDVTDVLGAGDDCRVYPFGEAPDDVAHPYAVFQLIEGQPQNYLGESPDADSTQVQIDVYGSSPSAVRTAVKALAQAVEGGGYITRWGARSRDPRTRNYRISFDVEFIVKR